MRKPLARARRSRASRTIFAASPDCINVERVVEVLERQLVRDDRREVDAAARHERLRLIPGLEHPAPVDAEHVSPLKMMRSARLISTSSDGMPSSAATPPLRTIARPLSIAEPRTRHLEQHVDAVAAGAPTISSIRSGCVAHEHRVGADALGERELLRVHVDREHLRRAGGARDGDRHQPDRADAGDRRRFRRHAGGHHGMHRVAERIEDGRPAVGDRGVEPPHVRFRHADVVGERAVGVDADDLHVLADVRLTGAAQRADPARDVTFRRDAVADGERRVTAPPTAATSPMNSWPIVSGGFTRRCAQ